MSETATKAALYAALAKAQSEYGTVDRTATNPHFKSKYAPLDKVLDAIGPALSANGLCHYWRQSMGQDGEFVIVTVTAGIGHGESGESIESSLSWGVPDDVQKLGSALTYLRRYTIEAVAGVAADSDDDGNGSASERTPARAVTPTNAAKTQAAIDKGKANQDDEATVKFGEALASIRWTLADFKAELVDFAGIKVPNVIAKPYSQWPEWAKVKARELYEKIRAGDGDGPLPEPPPPPPGVPEDDEIPF
jgi:hypothetical protein